MEVYPAKYTDKNGEFETMIRNDWKNLQFKVKNVEFFGTSFDSFQPNKFTPMDNLVIFDLDKHNELCNYQIKCEIPVIVLESSKETKAILNVKFERKTSQDEDLIYKLLLTMKYRDEEFQSTVLEDFEECLGQISSQLRKLPNEPALKCCFGCGLSDYSVYGHGIFGSLLCFKKQKDKFLDMKTRFDYYDLLEEKNLEYVQETYLCSEYRSNRR